MNMEKKLGTIWSSHLKNFINVIKLKDIFCIFVNLSTG